jgi:membrane-associated phospholipid phosphatase
MHWILILLASLSPRAHATVDDAARSSLRWENHSAAASSSDYLLAGHVAGAFAFTVDRGGDRRWEKAGALLGTYAGNIGLNYLVKRAVARERPNGVNRESFYSGHTSTAFVGAGAVCLQDPHAACYTALGLAALVGYLRIAADWHWLSDVAVGGGVGFLNGRLMPTMIVRF